MTPAVAQAMYRRQFGAHGEDIIVRRIGPGDAILAQQTVRARVMGFQPAELVNGITQADRKIMILAESVASYVKGSGGLGLPLLLFSTANPGFSLPMKVNGTDRIVVRGRAMTPKIVDDSTARIGDALLAYIITATG